MLAKLKEILLGHTTQFAESRAAGSLELLAHVTSPSSYAERIRLDRRTAFNELQRMVKEGKAIKIGRGKYILLDDMEEILKKMEHLGAFLSPWPKNNNEAIKVPEKWRVVWYTKKMVSKEYSVDSSLFKSQNVFGIFFDHVQMYKGNEYIVLDEGYQTLVNFYKVVEEIRAGGKLVHAELDHVLVNLPLNWTIKLYPVANFVKVEGIPPSGYFRKGDADEVLRAIGELYANEFVATTALLRVLLEAPPPILAKAYDMVNTWIRIAKKKLGRKCLALLFLR